MVIKSFKCDETLKIWCGNVSRRLPGDIQQLTRRKLRMITAASNLEDLRVPLNHLKKLKGRWSNNYSIRINDQWRICFLFEEGNAYEVEIIDYH